MNRSRLQGLGMVAVLALAALSGCVATSQSAPARGVVVNGPPPPPLAEERPTQPRQDAPPGTQWVAGYWHWTGMQYAWIPGHWENPPPGATWAGPRYVTADGAYFYEPGGWRGGPQGPAPTPGPAAPPPQAHANALR